MRIADSVSPTLRPSPSPVGEVTSWEISSRISTECRPVMVSKIDSTSSTEPPITNPAAMVSWRGRSGGAVSLMGTHGVH